MNSELTLAQITRAAVELFRRTNAFVGQFDDMFYDPAHQEKRRKADERSIELLRSWLTSAQLFEYDMRQRFFVRGSETGERYLITSPAQAYNVAQLDDDDQVVLRLCFVPKGDVKALGDVMLAQKIMIETDELEARAIANRLTAQNVTFTAMASRRSGRRSFPHSRLTP